MQEHSPSARSGSGFRTARLLHIAGVIGTSTAVFALLASLTAGPAKATHEPDNDPEVSHVFLDGFDPTRGNVDPLEIEHDDVVPVNSGGQIDGGGGTRWIEPGRGGVITRTR